ncbi:hypothetical protein QF019_003258 [Pseudomonas frederiksbergensis]
MAGVERWVLRRVSVEGVVFFLFLGRRFFRDAPDIPRLLQ